MATCVQEDPPSKKLNGVRSPGLLAKWSMIGLFLFFFGGLLFGALFYHLRTQDPLLEWDRTLATTLAAIGLKNPATLKPIMDAGYYLEGRGVIILALLFGIYFNAKRDWQEYEMVAIGLGGESLLFLTLSNSIGSLRPPTQIWIILKIQGFPSGHAMAVAVFSGLLAYLWHRKCASPLGRASWQPWRSSSSNGEVQLYQARKLKVKSSPK